ncbi:MAG: hypothetical protein ABF651_00030 [Sporolactobacillus sp.]
MEDLERLICGVGRTGKGKFKTTNKDYSLTKSYNIWTSMIYRCYSGKCPGYNNCSVSDEWLTGNKLNGGYQQFAQWYEDNYYTCGDERMEIDKDILVPGNHTYAPDRCLIIPQKINLLFAHKNIESPLPLGVSYHPNRTKTFMAGNNKKFLGYYETADEAGKVFKEWMMNEIWKMSDEYEGRVPDKVIQAMRDYKFVE